jgi:hypothetical protein
MPADQQIKDLCRRAARAGDDQKFGDVLIELRIALREYVRSAENLGIHLILNAPKAQSVES